jgi:hypothetical protein
LCGRLRRHWRKTKPDLVVSLVPNFNRAMCDALAAALPEFPYVTVLTDFADYPPHFWIEPNQRQHLICGTSKAVSQAHAPLYRCTDPYARSMRAVNCARIGAPKPGAPPRIGSIIEDQEQSHEQHLHTQGRNAGRDNHAAGARPARRQL